MTDERKANNQLRNTQHGGKLVNRRVWQEYSVREVGRNTKPGERRK